MRCRFCHIEKLSGEYPSGTISNACKHAPSVCLSCISRSFETSVACPECGQPCGNEDVRRVRDGLNSLRLQDESSIIADEVKNGTTNHSHLHVCLLQGDKFDVPYSPGVTLKELKANISRVCDVEVSKQRILFKGSEIKGDRSLEDFGIGAGATVHLIIMLYSIPQSSNIKDVVFDLFWGYPGGRRDYLDGSCLLYSKNDFLALADYQQRVCFNGAVTHSGDVMNEAARVGHHTIHVHLQRLDRKVDKAFFVLSSWKSPNLSFFPNPSVRLFEESRRTEQLCEYSIGQAGAVQAVVMCVMARSNEDEWVVEAIGRRSSGTVRDYSMMRATIADIIKNMANRY